MVSTEERREELWAVLWWCTEDEPRTTEWLTDRLRFNGIDLQRHGAQDRVHDDLVRLHKQGAVTREGRPAKWAVMPELRQRRAARVL